MQTIETQQVKSYQPARRQPRHTYDKMLVLVVMVVNP